MPRFCVLFCNKIRLFIFLEEPSFPLLLTFVCFTWRGFFPFFLCLRKVFLPSLLAQILPPPESFPGLDLLSHLWTQPVCPFFRMGLVKKKKPACQCRINGLDPWIWKIPWRRKWQPTPIFLPGKSHGPRSLAGYGSWGQKTIRHSLVTKWQQQQIFTLFLPKFREQF